MNTTQKDKLKEQLIKLSEQIIIIMEENEALKAKLSKGLSVEEIEELIKDWGNWEGIELNKYEINNLIERVIYRAYNAINTKEK